MPSVAEWWQNETFIPLDWSPPLPTPAPRHRRWVRGVLALVIVALAATSGGLGWLAWSQHRAAQREQAVVHVQAAELRALDSEMNARGQLLSSSTTVAGELQACIDATNRASSDLFGFLTGEDKKVETTCNTAEADYQQLQSATGGSQ